MRSDPSPSAHTRHPAPAEAVGKAREDQKVPDPLGVSTGWPHHLREPWSCRSCRHHDFYRPRPDIDQMICRKDRFEHSCVFCRASDNLGSCPADPVTGKPLNFEPRSTL